MTKIHLVQIMPIGINDCYRLLKWNKARGVPGPNGESPSRKLLRSGMVCEIDDADLEEAQTFGTVKIIGTTDIE